MLFLFIAWGSGRKADKIERVGRGYCSNCECERYFSIYEVYDYAHLYWVFRWKTSNDKKMLLCEQCKSGWHVSEDEISKLIEGTMLLPGQSKKQFQPIQNDPHVDSGPKCFICGKGQDDNKEFLRFKGKIYCKECFICVSCEKQIRTGMAVTEIDGEIYCGDCAELHRQS